MGQQRGERHTHSERDNATIWQALLLQRPGPLPGKGTQSSRMCAATINKMNYNKNRKEKRRKRTTGATVAVTWGGSWTKEEPVEHLRIGLLRGWTGQKECREGVDRVQGKENGAPTGIRLLKNKLTITRQAAMEKTFEEWEMNSSFECWTYFFKILSHIFSCNLYSRARKQVLLVLPTFRTKKRSSTMAELK